MAYALHVNRHFTTPLLGSQSLALAITLPRLTWPSEIGPGWLRDPIRPDWGIRSGYPTSTTLWPSAVAGLGLAFQLRSTRPQEKRGSRAWRRGSRHKMSTDPVD